MDNRIHYFDWAANGLMTPEVHQAVVRSHAALAQTGSIAAAEHRDMLTKNVRKACARLLHTDGDTIVLAPNTSTLIISLAATLQPHLSTVGALAGEYPSLLLPFERQGFRLKRFETPPDGSLDLDAYLDFLIGEKVGLAILSHVQWDTGVRADIRRFCAVCKSEGIRTLIDATQSMGIIEMNLRALGADIVVASTYKWLQAGFGLAVASLSHDFRTDFHARIGGFGSMRHDGSLPEASSTAFYEPGHLSSPTMAALLCSIEQKLAAGMPELEMKASKKAEQLLEIIQYNGFKIKGLISAQKRGMIICYSASKAAHDALLAAGFQCSYRSEGIRLSVHYSTPEETIGALEEYYRKQQAVIL